MCSAFPSAVCRGNRLCVEEALPDVPGEHEHSGGDDSGQPPGGNPWSSRYVQRRGGGR